MAGAALRTLLLFTDGGAGGPVLAGQPLWRHHLAIAARWGATRLIAVRSVNAPPLHDFANLAEEQGMTLQYVQRTGEAADRVAPGEPVLLLMPSLAAPALLEPGALDWASRPGVLGIETIDRIAGLERIDLNRHWAGAMVLDGADLAAVADLPGEWEPVSAALRIGLQRGYPVKGISESVLASGGIGRADDPGALGRIEERMLSATLAGGGARPLDRLAAPLRRRLVRAGWDRPALARLGWIAAPVAGLAAILAGFAGIPALALAMLVLALAASRLLPPPAAPALADAGSEAVLALVLAGVLLGETGQYVVAGSDAAILVLGARLLSTMPPERGVVADGVLSDPLVLAVLAAIAWLAGGLPAFVALAGLALVARRVLAGALAPHRREDN